MVSGENWFLFGEGQSLVTSAATLIDLGEPLIFADLR